MGSIEPDAEQLRVFIESADNETPITMLNLLRYRAEADYAGHPDETPCSGREAYRRYAEHAIPCVEANGGKVALAGATGPTVIGPESEQWDDILVVAWPSRQAMIDMLGSEGYQRIAYHRSAALTDSRLIPFVPGALSFES